MDDSFRSSARHQYPLARTLSRALLLLFALCSVAHAEDLLWPLGNNKTLTGGFADTRPEHFHGGLDVHTGPDHLPVAAPEDGWIERIAVTPPGYGRVLYFRLPDGRTAVFGHLDHFNPVLEKMLRDSELVHETYAVDLLFDKASPEREFHRGDILAYTGHTGAGPAHFHYEIREGAVQTDPLLNYGPHDDQSPVIVSLRWTTLSQFSPVNAGEPIRTGKSRRKSNDETIIANEPIALFVQAYDPSPWGRNATPYLMRVKVNGQIAYIDTSARIDLLGPRAIYAKTVLGFQTRKHLDLWRLFHEPPPPEYQDSIRDGVGWLSQLNHADVTIEIVDRAGNMTNTSINVTCGAWPRTSGKPLPREIKLGEFCLDTKSDPLAAWAQLSQVQPHEVNVGPTGFAFGGRTRLCCCLSDAERKKGAYLYERSGKSTRAQWPSLNDAGDTLSCMILRGGTYGIGFDSEPPTLSLSAKHGKITFRLTDDLAGVDYATIRCEVDKRTAIADFEYEERGGDIWTQEPLTRGSHEVSFTAADRAGNSRRWHETILIR
jgi:hypothetical protein